MTITLRPIEPWERVLKCSARRGAKGRGSIMCEKEALHAYGIVARHGHEHAGRDRQGRWYYWWVN